MSYVLKLIAFAIMVAAETLAFLWPFLQALV